MLEVPYWVRQYKGAYEGNNDDIHWYQNNSIGDIRIQGMYTGLSEDMSTGLLMGVKVPSGDWTYPNYDRDTQIGTGSTDLLMGVYHIGHITEAVGDVAVDLQERPFNYFVQVNYNLPLWGQDHYTPGREVDGAVGPTTTLAKSVLSANLLRCSPFSPLTARATPARTQIPPTAATPALSLLREWRRKSGSSGLTQTSRFHFFKT